MHLTILGILRGELFQLMFQIHIFTIKGLILRQCLTIGKGINQLGLEKTLGEGKCLILGMNIQNMRS